MDDVAEDSPHVFLTDGTHDEPAIMDIVHKFTLNKAQERVFRIIAYHTLGRSKVGPQLRMGVFGEGGTGKSRLIAAVRAWFAVLNRQNELMVTATTGSAAFNVAGTTLHSAANLPIGKQKKKKIGSDKGKGWIDRHYLIVDEVSMMDCKMLVNLNTNLEGEVSAQRLFRRGQCHIYGRLSSAGYHIAPRCVRRQTVRMGVWSSAMEIHQHSRLAYRANEAI